MQISVRRGGVASCIVSQSKHNSRTYNMLSSLQDSLLSCGGGGFGTTKEKYLNNTNYLLNRFMQNLTYICLRVVSATVQSDGIKDKVWHVPFIAVKYF